MNIHDRSISVVGGAETDRLGRLPDYSPLALAQESALNAARDAGISLSDIDGFATTLPEPWEAARYIGITPGWVDGTTIGGCSYLAHLRHAAAAIAAGLATTVLIAHGESGRSRVGMPSGWLTPYTPSGQFEQSQGLVTPALILGLPVLRFLHNRGMSRADLAEVVVAQREWAAMNPRALKRTATSVDEVLAARPVAFPFTADMCCVVTDGGGAVILTTTERAADLRHADRPVLLAGSAERVQSGLAAQMPSADSMQAVRESGRAALATSGLRTEDIDHLMIYDAFASIPLYGLEDIGFVAPGESGAFIREGHTRPGGILPMNTNGGGLNYTHTGMYGMFALLEAVRQLRGTADAQVDNVRTSLIQGIGMMFGAAATVILANDR